MSIKCLTLFFVVIWFPAEDIFQMDQLNLQGAQGDGKKDDLEKISSDTIDTSGATAGSGSGSNGDDAGSQIQG